MSFSSLGQTGGDFVNDPKVAALGLKKFPGKARILADWGAVADSKGTSRVMRVSDQLTTQKPSHNTGSKGRGDGAGNPLNTGFFTTINEEKRCTDSDQGLQITCSLNPVPGLHPFRMRQAETPESESSDNSKTQTDKKPVVWEKICNDDC